VILTHARSLLLRLLRYNGKILVGRFKGFSPQQLEEIRATQLKQLEEKKERTAAEVAERQVSRASLQSSFLPSHTRSRVLISFAVCLLL